MCFPPFLKYLIYPFISTKKTYDMYQGAVSDSMDIISTISARGTTESRERY